MRTSAVFLILLLVAACGPIVVYPVTDGFNHNLPNSDTKVVVWGEQTAVTGTATSWLSRRGLTMLDSGRLRQMIDEQSDNGASRSAENNGIWHAGDLIGADVVVLTESHINFIPAEDHDGGIEHEHGAGSGQIHGASVTLRGVNLETSEILWSGSARMREPVFGNADDTLAQLTCQALATAWDYRPSGRHHITSREMCNISS